MIFLSPHKYKLLLLIIAALFTGSSVVAVYAQEGDINTASFSDIRIEQEDKIFVPLDKADEVRNFHTTEGMQFSVLIVLGTVFGGAYTVIYKVRQRKT